MLDQCENEKQQLMVQKKSEQLDYQAAKENGCKEISIQMQETLAKFASLQQNYKLLKDEFADYKEECTSVSTKQSQKINDLMKQNEKKSSKTLNEEINNSRPVLRVSKENTNIQFNAQIEETENFYSVTLKNVKTVHNKLNQSANAIPRGVVPFDDSKFQDTEAANSKNDVQTEEKYKVYGVDKEHSRKTVQNDKFKNEVNEDQGKAYPEHILEDEHAEDGKLSSQHMTNFQTQNITKKLCFFIKFVHQIPPETTT